MKTATTAMQAHLQGNPTTLAYLWNVTRTDGTVLGFTSHDLDIDYPPSTSGPPYSRTLTIPAPSIGSNLTNFTFPVAGTYAYLATLANGGKVHNSSGYDIIFTSDSAGLTLLKWEVEFYDPTTGAIVAWVQVPTVSHTASTVIYMWYGNTSISTFQGGSLGAAWDANFGGVWHFPNGATLSAADSSANANNGTLSSPPPTAAAGQIDGGAAFVGSSTEYIDVPANTALKNLFAGDFTLECWVKSTAVTPAAGILSIGTGAGGSGEVLWDVGVFTSGDFPLYFGGAWRNSGAAPVAAGAWQHLAVVFSSVAGTLTFYRNGAAVGSPVTSLSAGATPSADFVIGAQGTSFFNPYTGAMDEVRISKTARTADWLAAEYSSISTPSSFFALGSEVPTESDVDSTTYLAATGFTNTATKASEDLSVDNMDVFAFLEADSLTEADIRAGLYDDATIQIMLVNWADLTMGAVIIRTGTVGNIKMRNGMLTAEIRGLAYKFTQVIGNTYGPLCRAEFGSGINSIDLNSKYLCHIDVTAYRQTGSVTSVFDARTLVPAGGLDMVGSSTPSTAAPAGWFNDGLIHFTSGALDDFTFDIKSWDGVTLTLFSSMPVAPAPGDTFWIEPGCDRTAPTCQNKYANIVNFRGENFIPGMDQILSQPSG